LFPFFLIDLKIMTDIKDGYPIAQRLCMYTPH
jgi:hypothetical protein